MPDITPTAPVTGDAAKAVTVNRMASVIAARQLTSLRDPAQRAQLIAAGFTPDEINDHGAAAMDLREFRARQLRRSPHRPLPALQAPDNRPQLLGPRAKITDAFA